MATATIKVFLPHGDPKSLRTAEVSNWSGKAIAAPRTLFELFLSREELGQSGIYILTGVDPDSGRPLAYVGEAEVLRDRLRQHKAKEFWVSVIVFLSKDENLTKSHIRFLEGRLIEEAREAARFDLDNGQSSGSRLPESDRHDMEEFLERVRLLLPILGSELLTPVSGRSQANDKSPHEILVTQIKGLTARGRRTPDGFVVLKGSQAVSRVRDGAATHGSVAVRLRVELSENGVLVDKGAFWEFARDHEFSSPSAAAAVVQGGNANGLTAWKDAAGRSLKDIES